MTAVAVPEAPLGLRVLSTADVPDREGFDYWLDAVSTAFVPLECHAPEAETFSGEIVSRDLGSYHFSHVTARPHRVTRTRNMIARDDPGMLKVCLQVAGTARISQAGREAEIAPGDLAIYDTTQPYVLSFEHNRGRCETYVFMFPADQLGLQGDALSRSTAIPIDGATGTGALVAPFLLRLAETATAGALDLSSRMAQHSIALLETIFRERLDMDPALPDARSGVRLAEIRAWIQRNLHNPDLTPSDIAEAHHISLRYLHQLFAAEGTSVARWTKERRLERCRQDLSDPTLAHRSVGAIAARWGMMDAATFSRAFKGSYGFSPRDFRLRSLSDVASAR